MEPVIVIHGGAGDIPESSVPGKLNGVANAVMIGSEILLAGKSAVEAVVAAVKVMEDDPFFNAGKGAVLNINGQVEMDAMVMEGNHLKTGAVTGVRGIEHPIELANLVKNKSPHVLLAGEGANIFALKEGVPRIPEYRLVTQNAIDALESFLNNQGAAVSEVGSPGGVGTVGAVALDKNGTVASATSTGGITGKQVGRVGDSPLPGCGTYANNNSGAVSATGTGEAIMRVCLAHRILQSIEKGVSAQEATEEAVMYMEDRVQGTGGAVTVSSTGDIGVYFNSDRMAWAYRRGSQPLHTGIDFPPEN